MIVNGVGCWRTAWEGFATVVQDSYYHRHCIRLLAPTQSHIRVRLHSSPLSSYPQLKKKNQELEKFKFVLDYKIKELKGQVEPREAEIGAMRSQIKEVDSELEAYHKSNTDLDGLIGRLRAELDNLQLEATNLRAEVNTRGTSIRNFSSDLYTVIQAAKTPQDFTKGWYPFGVQARPVCVVRCCSCCRCFVFMMTVRWRVCSNAMG